MKKTEAMELAKDCVKELANALRGGEPDSLRRYLDAMARFHRYSLGNILMIVSQRPDAEYVAGFKAWKDLGRWVKPGEKGIAIIAPMVGKKKELEKEDEADQGMFSGFRVVHVFDVKQTDGDDLPELSEVEGDPGEAHELLIQVYRTLGIGIVRGHLPKGTLGSSSGGRVALAIGMSPAKEFQVLAHELAHELLHQGKEGHHSTMTMDVVETEAEAVAYVVCKAHGIDAMAVTSEYIRMYDGDAKTIEESFSRIRSTAARILFLISEADEARRFANESRVNGFDETISRVWSHVA